MWPAYADVLHEYLHKLIEVSMHSCLNCIHVEGIWRNYNASLPNCKCCLAVEQKKLIGIINYLKRFIMYKHMLWSIYIINLL